MECGNSLPLSETDILRLLKLAEYERIDTTTVEYDELENGLWEEPIDSATIEEAIKAVEHTTHGTVVYPVYQTAMFHLKAFPDDELEAVQTRKEKYNDHGCRNPETAFGTIRENCMRRDLTINALYQNVSTGDMLDITGHGHDVIRDTKETELLAEA